MDESNNGGAIATLLEGIIAKQIGELSALVHRQHDQMQTMMTALGDHDAEICNMRGRLDDADEKAQRIAAFPELAALSELFVNCIIAGTSRAAATYVEEHLTQRLRDEVRAAVEQRFAEDDWASEVERAINDHDYTGQVERALDEWRVANKIDAAITSFIERYDFSGDIEHAVDAMDLDERADRIARSAVESELENTDFDDIVATQVERSEAVAEQITAKVREALRKLADS